MNQQHIMEGYGPLDMFIAKLRYRMARRKIRAAGKTGRILDIGCGSYPLFLTTVDFEERYGLDQNVEADIIVTDTAARVHLAEYRAGDKAPLAFQDEFFDVVTMLAVFEHIEATALVELHREIHRVLKPGGLYVMTTPAWWTDGLLRLLGKLRLISQTIDEHADNYTRSSIFGVLREAGFDQSKLRFGYFELFANTWTTATK